MLGCVITFWVQYETLEDSSISEVIFYDLLGTLSRGLKKRARSCKCKGDNRLVCRMTERSE